ncbi:histidine phosphatase family protein, partial [Kocuria oceani]
VLTSPLERTRETAEPTEARTGRAAVVDPGLLECDFGEWTGAELSRLSRLTAWSTVQRAPSTFRFPGGESFPEMQARMVGAVDRARAEHEGGVVVCFSHADPIKAVLAHALGTHLDLFQRIVVSPCSVSAISYAPGQAPAVLTLNSTHEPLSGLRVS